MVFRQLLHFFYEPQYLFELFAVFHCPAPLFIAGPGRAGGGTGGVCEEPIVLGLTLRRDPDLVVEYSLHKQLQQCVMLVCVHVCVGGEIYVVGGREKAERGGRGGRQS